MEILIIGAGALGGLFGAMLGPFAQVRLCTTNAEHALAINRDGLLLTGMDGALRRVPVTALTDPAQSDRRADLILVCTKARSTEAAAQTAQRLLAADGLTLTLQNGLGNLERITPWSDLRGLQPALPPRPPPCSGRGASVTPAAGRPCLPPPPDSLDNQGKAQK